MRREFSKATKRDAFTRANGCCEECGQKLFVGNVEYDHRTEDFMGGEPTLENCVVLCRGCHRAKTRARAPVIAKTRRQADRNAGIRKPASMRHPKFRKRMDGKVVNRETGELMR